MEIKDAFVYFLWNDIRTRSLKEDCYIQYFWKCRLQQIDIKSRDIIIICIICTVYEIFTTYKKGSKTLPSRPYWNLAITIAHISTHSLIQLFRPSKSETQPTQRDSRTYGKLIVLSFRSPPTFLTWPSRLAVAPFADHRSQITAFGGKWERADLIAPLRAWSWELEAVGSTSCLQRYVWVNRKN